MPANFWVETGHPIISKVPTMSFRGQKFILKNKATKTTKFCK